MAAVGIKAYSVPVTVYTVTLHVTKRARVDVLPQICLGAVSAHASFADSYSLKCVFHVSVEAVFFAAGAVQLCQAWRVVYEKLRLLARVVFC
jgi:hypothetical protein